MGIELQGLREVTKTLNDRLNAITKGAASGLVQGALLIRREAQKNAPVVIGNLKNSAFVLTSREIISTPNFKGKQAIQMSIRHENSILKHRAEIQVSQVPLVIVGFTAAYAPYVHENPNAGAVNLEEKATRYNPKHKRWRGKRVSQRIRFSTVGGYKFLERAIRENMERVFQLVVEGAKGK